jgi:hypothetical protein
MGYDVIGDVHGQDGKLVALLRELGYRVKDGAYRHPAGRVALFLGDLIDRGPGQVECVDIVRRMIDAGSARSVMGNHELNAIAYANPCEDGYLRPHSAKNEAQHTEFLRQVGWESPLHRDLVCWFKSLPPCLDLGGIRVCHAWWNEGYIGQIAARSNPDGSLEESFLLDSLRKGSDAYRIMEGVTKGMELQLPSDASFTDHAGVERKDVRVRWWDAEASTYRKAAAVPEEHREGIPDTLLPTDVSLGIKSGVPTFLGHYWLTGAPSIQNRKTAVLDYSAAKDGPLVAYRWDGESELHDGGFVAVGGR